MVGCMDVFAGTEYSFGDIVHSMQPDDLRYKKTIEFYRSRSQRLLAEYLEKASELYYAYKKENNLKWLEMMEASYRIACEKMSIERMARQYSEVFRHIREGKISLEDIIAMGERFKDLGVLF